MKRRFLTIVSAMSLLLFLLIAALWTRSLFVDESIVWGSPHFEPPTVWREGAIGSSHGRILLSFFRDDEPALLPTERDRWLKMEPRLYPSRGPYYYERRVLIPLAARPHNPVLGFEVLSENGGAEIPLGGEKPYEITDRSWMYSVPYWFLALIAVSCPCFWTFTELRRRRREYRHRNNLCVACGYDLRASTGQCPECGAVRGKAEGGAEQREGVNGEE
jgi:hypothetical protein